MPTARPRRGARPALLAALAAIGPFSIDTYLPSFQDIGAGLDAPLLAVQQTLSVCLLAFAAMIRGHGALADARGLRRVILGALAVFALAAFVRIWAFPERVAERLNPEELPPI